MKLYEILPPLIKTYGEVTRREFVKIELTPAQVRVLGILFANNNLIQKELANKACVEPTTISRVIDVMVQHELILRTQSANSRRSFNISITEKGKEKLIQARECTQRINDSAIASFTAQDRENLSALLIKLKETLENIRKQEE